MKKLLLLPLLFFILTNCTTNRKTINMPAEPSLDSSMHNSLTKQEKLEGWKLLFDGVTLEQWRNFKSDNIGGAWKAINGELRLTTDNKKEGEWQVNDGGDIITKETYKDFELVLEWKVSECGNSGIIYNVHESKEYDYVWETGPEMQILDNSCHPDARITKHRAGDLYDLIACSEETVKPAKQWNQVRIISNQGKVEHWLNGVKVVSFTMFTPEWKEMIAKSKFIEMPGFGTFDEGHISFQDHGDQVAFRNIKIKKL